MEFLRLLLEYPRCRTGASFLRRENSFAYQRVWVEIQAMAVSEQIRKKLGVVPHKPGVYLHKDRLGTVIYVGKARDLRKRISQYFHPSRRLGWDLKFNALVEAIYDFDVHVVKSEPEALLLESKLIKDFKPRFNVSLRDDKRYLMLKVNLERSNPKLHLHATEKG